MPQPHPTGSFDALHGHAYASLTTLRRDGTPVVTPVWFALEGGRVYVVTTFTVCPARTDAGFACTCSTRTTVPSLGL